MTLNNLKRHAADVAKILTDKPEQAEKLRDIILSLAHDIAGMITEWRQTRGSVTRVTLARAKQRLTKQLQAEDEMRRIGDAAQEEKLCSDNWELAQKIETMNAGWRQASRKETRDKLADIARFAKKLSALRDDPDLAWLLPYCLDRGRGSWGGVTSDALSSLAKDAQAAADQIPTAAGKAVMGDALGRPKPQQFTARAAVSLFEAAYGHKPGKTNTLASDLCAELWRIAHGIASTGNDEDPPEVAWERHLRDVLSPRRGRTDAAIAAEVTIQLNISSALKRPRSY